MEKLSKLYSSGLVCLKDLVEEYGENSKIEEMVETVFFSGKFSKTQLNTLLFFQTNAKIDSCLRNLAHIVGMMYDRFKDCPFYLHLDLYNSRNIVLPPYIISSVYLDGKDADLCIDELVLPLYYSTSQEANLQTSNILKLIKRMVGKGDCKLEPFISKLAESFIPTFFFPTEDEEYCFAYINDKKVELKPHNVYGTFTCTESLRITRIGPKIYVEFIKDDILYKQYIDISTEQGQLEFINLYQYSQVSDEDIVLMSKYLKRKGEAVICLTK